MDAEFENLHNRETTFLKFSRITFFGEHYQLCPIIVLHVTAEVQAFWWKSMCYTILGPCSNQTFLSMNLRSLKLRTV